MTPTILLPWITVCWLSARSPEMNQLLEVSAGMLNQKAGMNTRPVTTSMQIETVRTVHINHSP